MARKFQDAGQTNRSANCAYSADVLGQPDGNPGDVPASYKTTTERPRYYSTDEMDQGKNMKGNK